MLGRHAPLPTSQPSACSMRAATSDARSRDWSTISARIGAAYSPPSSLPAGIIMAVKIVSVMTTDSPGGAEFAAVEMLEALRQRGHDTVMLTDMASMARDTGVRVAPISIGPKLSTGSWPGLALRWPLLGRRLREALSAQAPYDVLMVHYKKEQLLVPSLPPELRRTVVWAEWGPVPFPLRRGLPRRRYLRA